MSHSRYIRPVTPSDLQYLADNLRDEDYREIEASTHLPPLPALLTSLAGSEVTRVICLDEDVPCAVFGTSVIGPNVHSLWMVGTSDMAEKHPRTIARYSKAVIEELFETTGALVFFNLTHKPNTLHHRWLRWCGAIVGKNEVLSGPNLKEPFYPFVIYNKKLRDINNVY